MSDTTSKDDELIVILEQFEQHGSLKRVLKDLRAFGIQERIDELSHVEHPWSPEYVLARKAELTALKDKEIE